MAAKKKTVSTKRKTAPTKKPGARAARNKPVTKSTKTRKATSAARKNTTPFGTNLQRLADAGTIQNPHKLTTSDRNDIESLSSAETDALIAIHQKVGDFEGAKKIPKQLPCCIL